MPLVQYPSGQVGGPPLLASQASENIELGPKLDKHIEGDENRRTFESSQGDSNVPNLHSHESEALNQQANQNACQPTPDKDRETPSRQKWIGSTIAVLAIISTGIFFGLQYHQANGLALIANTLAVEESCRSHPVCTRPYSGLPIG
jgi:hypothetical protein